MNQAVFKELIHALGPEKVTGFFLVLGRVAPLFMIAPLFSSRMVPARVRGIIAVGLSIGLTGVATHGQRIPGAPLEVALLFVEGLLTGLAFAFAVSAVFAAVQAAGSLTDTVAGFSFGATVDPVNGNQGGALTQLYGLVGVAMFLSIGGDAWILRGLARTFDVVPLTRGPEIHSLVAGAETAVGSIFVSAIEIAAPALLALLVTDIAFGMVSRVVPQLNVFAVGFPMKIGVGLLVVSTSLPFVTGWMSGQIAGAVGLALQTLRVG